MTNEEKVGNYYFIRMLKKSLNRRRQKTSGRAEDLPGLRCVAEESVRGLHGFCRGTDKERLVMKPVTPKQIWERALAGAKWLVQHQNQDGSWTGLKEQRVGAFYKASWAFSEVGQCAAAHRTLDYVYHHFFTAEGDFLTENPDTELPLLGRFPYVNSYFIAGSMRAGRYEIALPAVSFLLTQQSEDHGGFYSRPTRYGTKNMSDTMSSSSAGMACLATGRLEAARRVADYLSHIVDLQPWPDDHFFTTIDADGRLYTDMEDDGEAYLRLIHTRRADQCWYAVGLPMAFLVLLELATNDTGYRELAQWYFNFQQRCVNPGMATQAVRRAGDVPCSIALRVKNAIGTLRCMLHKAL